MTDRSKIEWCHATINPVTGCSPVSEGCLNCYAARNAATRLKKHPMYKGLAAYKDGRGHWTGEIRMNPTELDNPLRWRKPRRIFVCPAGDLFHEGVPKEFIYKVFAKIYWDYGMLHQFLFLTKRSKRMHDVIWDLNSEWASDKYGFEDNAGELVFQNCWLGFTAENQARFDERWAHVKQIPAAIVWVSHEPALGRIDYPEDFLARGRSAWVVTGGESGPRARPMHPDIPRHDRDQCAAAGVPYFFKQWGEWTPMLPVFDEPCRFITPSGEIFNELEIDMYGIDDGCCIMKVGKKAAGHMLDEREWKDYPTILI